MPDHPPTKMDASGFPRHIGEITPQWIDQILYNAGAIEAAHVTAVEMKVIGESVGWLSSVARVKLTYDPPEAVNGGAPATVVVKIEPEREEIRRMGQEFHAFELQIRFHSHVP